MGIGSAPISFQTAIQVLTVGKRSFNNSTSSGVKIGLLEEEISHKNVIQIEVKDYLENCIKKLKDPHTKFNFKGYQWQAADILHELWEKKLFKSFAEACRFGEKTMLINGKPITAKQLRKAYDSKFNN